ncbi:MAG: 4,5-DOPA dioxygenase extradiol [Bacteroidales bacterium]|nr:4,5-DOPA dioxygenase extradiol [Bacteroidales bacterium]
MQTYSNMDQMPLLFLGHGSPMNAIEENDFVTGFRNMGKSIPKPKAILCVSAHWETRGTAVTAMEKPLTIHDFGGFPKALFDVQYPAPGSPELAAEVKSLVSKTEIDLDRQWGLDHGAWSVIRHLYPNADIPVIQMSLDHDKTPEYHYELAKELSSLRNKGVLIIGSGNMVHNLRLVDWKNPDNGYDWAETASDLLKKLITGGDHQALIHYHLLGKEIQWSVPTPEHYLPMLYILGLKQEEEPMTFFNDKVVLGSMSMTSFKVG